MVAPTWHETEVAKKCNANACSTPWCTRFFTSSSWAGKPDSAGATLQQKKRKMKWCLWYTSVQKLSFFSKLALKLHIFFDFSPDVYRLSSHRDCAMQCWSRKSDVWLKTSKVKTFFSIILEYLYLYTTPWKLIIENRKRPNNRIYQTVAKYLRTERNCLY